MKQMNYLKMLLAGAMFVALVSCAKEDSIDNPNGQGGKDGARSVTLGLQLEPETKVNLSDAGVFSWVDGDKIAVWVGTSASSCSLQECSVNIDGSGTSISVGLNDGEDLYSAVYPYGEGYSHTYSSEALTISLPSSYAYEKVSGTNAPLPMVPVYNSASKKLIFYNVGGVLRLTVNNIPNDATGLDIQFPGKKVNGTFSVYAPGTINPTISTGTPESGEDIIRVTFAAGTAATMTLNIPLPTGTYEDLLIMPVGSSTKSATFQSITTGSYTVERAHGKKLTADMVAGFDLSTAAFSDNTISYAYIYQSNPSTTSNTITIADNQKVILDGVNIKAGDVNAINCSGNATIVLSGTNNVANSSGDKAVIKVGPSNKTLTISGDGVLDAKATSSSMYGAIIGSDKNTGCGNLVIAGGEIKAQGNNGTVVYGAAIGAGASEGTNIQCGTITISGGKVVAESSYGAGIGSGASCGSSSWYESVCNGIEINGGTIDATSGNNCNGQTTFGGAAIGSGAAVGSYTCYLLGIGKSKCQSISITGGEINAISKHFGAAIGSGCAGAVSGNITISGGKTIAECRFNYSNSGNAGGAGLGCGRYGDCGNITIEGGNLTARGSFNAVGIGSSCGSSSSRKSSCGIIKITDGISAVKATSGASTNCGAIGYGTSYSSCSGVIFGSQTMYSGSGSWTGGPTTGDYGGLTCTSSKDPNISTITICTLTPVTQQ